MMHTDLLSQLDPRPATCGLRRQRLWRHLAVRRRDRAGRPAAYAYIADRIGDTARPPGRAEYASLLKATNAGLAANEQSNDFVFLPCEVNVPITADRCGSANDANWAVEPVGENAGTIFLQGGELDGILGDPTQTDNLYEPGFADWTAPVFRSRRSVHTPATASR